MAKPRYVMIGGFLGAGKTTAVLRLAEHLTDQGLRVGLITNDQSHGLVDTAMLTSHGYAVEEIAGGCFCCRFNSLVEAARRLSEKMQPDVFLAEPVGSCTDLVATVSYPLRRIYGDDYAIAPLSVMVDPARAAVVLGIEDGRSFSEKVDYVYTKQLEEAQAIVVNKCDLLEQDRRRQIVEAMRERFPNKEIFVVSARQRVGLEQWFAHITSHELVPERAMQIDYDTYAEGEALLGWLNATMELSCPEPFDGSLVIHGIARVIQKHLISHGVQIAHLKVTLSPQEGADAVAVAVLNLVQNDGMPEVVQAPAHEQKDGSYNPREEYKGITEDNGVVYHQD